MRDSKGRIVSGVISFALGWAAAWLIGLPSIGSRQAAQSDGDRPSKARRADDAAKVEGASDADKVAGAAPGRKIDPSMVLDHVFPDPPVRIHDLPKSFSATAGRPRS